MVTRYTNEQLMDMNLDESQNVGIIEWESVEVT